MVTYIHAGASQVALVVKKMPANAGDAGDAGSIPGLRRSPRGGNGNPLQFTCLENPMGRGAWQVVVHSVAKSGTKLSTSTKPALPVVKTALVTRLSVAKSIYAKVNDVSLRDVVNTETGAAGSQGRGREPPSFVN